MQFPEKSLRILAVAAACLSFAACEAQQSGSSAERALPGPNSPYTGTSPVFDVASGATRLELYRNFTSIVRHNCRIRTVLDFDEELVKVDPNDQQSVTVYALAPGVTTLTIVDEFEETYRIDVFIREDTRELEFILRDRFPHDTIYVRDVKGEAVMLTGWVSSPENINEIEDIAKQFYATVLNHMKIGGVQQVMLKAQIMEVQRSKVRQFGLNFDIVKPDSIFASTPGPITPLTDFSLNGGAPSLAVSGVNQATIAYGFVRNGTGFRGFLVALREEGLLKLHAQPMVTTHNGQPAVLVNGGQTPVLTPAGLGTTAIEFKEFGVILQAVPHILGNGRLRLQISPEVSERDFSNAITVDGVTVPAFTVRKVQTEVEMNFGETLIVAGLISRRSDGAAQKVPLLGELPWIGSAFSRKRFSEGETELIIMITPEYVAPMQPNQIPAGGPGTFTDIPTDRELFFHNHLEIPSFGDECSVCPNCQMHGSCPQHPDGCPSCLPGSAGDNCVRTDAQSGSSMLIRPVAAPESAAGPSASGRNSVLRPVSGSSEDNAASGEWKTRRTRPTEPGATQRSATGRTSEPASRELIPAAFR